MAEPRTGRRTRTSGRGPLGRTSDFDLNTKDIQDWGCETDDKCVEDKGWGKRHKSFSPPDFEQTYDSFSDRIKDTSLPDSKTNPRILYLYSPPIIYF